MSPSASSPGSALGLLLLGLLAMDARADDDDDDLSCRIIQKAGAPAELGPRGERTQRACATKWCAGLNYYYMGSSHSLTCLYIADKAGTPLSTLRLGNDLRGLETVRFLDDHRLELSYETSTQSWSQVYELDARGQLKTPPPPPPPTARQRREQELLERKAQAEASRQQELEARSSCQQLDGEPTCGEQTLPEKERARLGEACGQPPERVMGVCSKAGCMGLVRNPAKEGRGYCVAWAPQRGPALVIPTPSDELRSIILDGAFICLNQTISCDRHTGFSKEECVDVSGPVARLEREPPGDVSGGEDYEVLPYRGEAPRIDGKAQEPEWKAPTLWLSTAAQVREGLEAWRGAKDASAEWIFRSRGDALLFLLRVHDDQVVASGTSEHDDGVRLRVGPDEGAERELRLLLAPGGKVRAMGAAQARCAWSATADGYRMECAIPLEALSLPRAPAAWRFSVNLEDRDGPGTPLKRLSSSNRLVAWSEYPPIWNELARLSSWNPCD